MAEETPEIRLRMEEATAQHGSESENELLFLRTRWAKLQQELADVERRTLDAGEAGRSSTLLEARRRHLRREQAIIDELFDETARASLERAIGYRLKRLQRDLFRSGRGGGGRRYYDQGYWDREADREILNGLLQDWQTWRKSLHGNSAQGPP